ncbi:MAG: acyltransferase family protein [Brachybacterium sp.]|uniref:acyltransferase family protein n=1 Tax=Brachybacterium sp. TaxID=1891286 RepID=UPI0026513FD6|nr:acyltransferase family protein [Brachybacterium sp.]MDN6302443.1 acyltransferase family protein [Brachybacterium sp.]MDN6328529.1 acyltransferase family protein [Brachybacterium sp.]MDN6399129.1 acyltransferase family protein [Brachybacterium sp.]
MSTTGTTTRPRRPRDPYLDNARGLLIALVVVGHTIECFENTADVLASTLYTAIYSFHMAAFIMISGYLSRSYRNEPRQVRRLLTAMVVPYVIFQVVHEAGKALLLGQDVELQLLLPAWTLWFLVALLGWRLLTPVLRQLKHPLMFAVAISVIAPLDPDLGSVLSLGRLAQMLPFFMLGLIATPDMLERVKAFRHRWLGGAVLLAVVVVAYLVDDRVPTSLFFLRSGYEDDTGILLSMLLQVMVLLAGVAGSLAILLVTPRGRSQLTAMGERSLTVYLLHPVLLLPVRYAEELPEWLVSWWGTLGLVAAALLLTAILATGVVGRLTSWLTDPPIGDLLVRSEDDAPQKPRPTAADGNPPRT